MARDTRTITTPITQKEVVLYTYLTGGEVEDIQAAIMTAAKPTLDERTGMKFSIIDGSLLNAGKHQSIIAAIQSFDGSVENILERLRGLPSQDYEFVVTEIEELSKKK